MTDAENDFPSTSTKPTPKSSESIDDTNGTKYTKPLLGYPLVDSKAYAPNLDRPWPKQRNLITKRKEMTKNLSYHKHNDITDTNNLHRHPLPTLFDHFS